MATTMMERAKSRSPNSAAACRPLATLGLTRGASRSGTTQRTSLPRASSSAAATNPSELGAAIEDAGFQGAVGKDLGGPDLNVRIRAVQFDSEEGALEARDLLHDEDLKPPCPEACVVTPIEYELETSRIQRRFITCLFGATCPPDSPGSRPITPSS